MGAVISATPFTLRDQGGTPRTMGYFTLEFRNSYTPGGEVFDLSAYFRRVETILAPSPISGALMGIMVRKNETDFPGDARSGRLQLDGLASGISWSFASGSLLVGSGFASGAQLLSGAGLFAPAPLSGFIGVSVASGVTTGFHTELLSGVGTSGTRLNALIIGY